MSDKVFSVNFQPWVTVDLFEGGRFAIDVDWSGSSQGEWLEDENDHDDTTVNSAVAEALVDSLFHTEPELLHSATPDLGKVQAHLRDVQIPKLVAQREQYRQEDAEAVLAGGKAYELDKHTQRDIDAARLLLTILDYRTESENPDGTS